MVTVHDEDALHLVDALNENGYFVIKIATTDDFLRIGDTMLICGVQDDKLENLVYIIFVEPELISKKYLTGKGVILRAKKFAAGTVANKKTTILSKRQFEYSSFLFHSYLIWRRGG